MRDKPRPSSQRKVQVVGFAIAWWLISCKCVPRSGSLDNLRQNRTTASKVIVTGECRRDFMGADGQKSRAQLGLAINEYRVTEHSRPVFESYIARCCFCGGGSHGSGQCDRLSNWRWIERRSQRSRSRRLLHDLRDGSSAGCKSGAAVVTRRDDMVAPGQSTHRQLS